LYKSRVRTFIEKREVQHPTDSEEIVVSQTKNCIEKVKYWYHTADNVHTVFGAYMFEVVILYIKVEKTSSILTLI